MDGKLPLATGWMVNYKRRRNGQLRAALIHLIEVQIGPVAQSGSGANRGADGGWGNEGAKEERWTDGLTPMTVECGGQVTGTEDGARGCKHRGHLALDRIKVHTEEGEGEGK